VASPQILEDLSSVFAKKHSQKNSAKYALLRGNMQKCWRSTEKEVIKKER